MKLDRLYLVAVVSVSLLTACGGDIANNEDGAAAEGTGAARSKVQETVHPGAQTYREACSSCHAPGLNGAPKFGDAQAWAPRIAKGPELLLQTTIEGIPPAMPPRGICMHCTDEQLADAIDYMVVNSQ